MRQTKKQDVELKKASDWLKRQRPRLKQLLGVKAADKLYARLVVALDAWANNK